MITSNLGFKKMADKHTSQGSCSSALSSSVVSLASKRLDALREQSRREKAAKVLSRRRRKWRKRNKLGSLQAVPPEGKVGDSRPPARTPHGV